MISVALKNRLRSQNKKSGLPKDKRGSAMKKSPSGYRLVVPFITRYFKLLVNNKPPKTAFEISGVSICWRKYLTHWLWVL